VDDISEARIKRLEEGLNELTAIYQAMLLEGWELTPEQRRAFVRGLKDLETRIDTAKAVQSSMRRAQQAQDAQKEKNDDG
jgi:hypothetical protein